MLQNDASWAVRFYTFKGESVGPHLLNEDLLEHLLRHERFVCDSNSSWKREADKSGNHCKMFILGHTVLDETDDVYGNIFGRRVNCANNNIYFFTNSPCQSGTCYLAIERYTPQSLLKHDPAKLKQVSRKRINKSDTQYLTSESDLMAQVRNEKGNILSLLKVRGIDLDNPPSEEIIESVKTELIQYVRSVSPKAFKDFRHCMNIAGLCYAALLLERDENGKKTRNEFNSPNRRNLWGDVLLLRDALWFKARILSNDGAVKRMAEYLALPEIKTTGIA